MNNQERSKKELQDFTKNPPQKYFCYVRHGDVSDHNYKPYYGKYLEIITWMGDILGTGRFTSNPFRSNFGDERITFTVKGINNLTYHGTFYFSAGDYARIRKGVNQ